ncbi:glycosyltransferase [Gluconobacter sp. Dm-62]|uniref:glycosyltransferase n=1 Tax=Gluconobacter sp. Dm-62 TaxID=2799804 RepID=UPI001B8C83C3|nr:glycosyltransferase [Gluconobacter sp. Dm-62]MBS1103235.1 glycosyltransferase [Gluconobacter sp. Dm-62]
MKSIQVAIVHEWLENWAGSELVIEQLIKCYPDAKIFSVVNFLSPKDRARLGNREIQTSFIQKLPFARKFFRHYLGLMPLAVEQFDLSGFDIVISSHHAVAKGIITGPDQLHVSYVHSPMRYAWDFQNTYLRQSGLNKGLRGLYIRWLFHRLRNWDVRTAAGVDAFVANSGYIARRIRKTWRRKAHVIPPPVNLDRFSVNGTKEDYYVVVSRLVPYKRIDLVVEAFRHMPDRKLIVIGGGTDAELVRQKAAGASNISLKGHISDAELQTTLSNARAFVYAGEEDFGISLVEAQAAGTPVIAYGRGGACDIVQPGTTGLLFESQSVESIVDAVQSFEKHEKDMTPELCHQNALRFSEELFRSRFTTFVEQQWQAFGPSRAADKV